MRDVSSKSNTLRSAKASATLIARTSTIEAIRSGHTPKIDPLGVAKVAAIQAAKHTSLLIPYCHQVPLDFVGVDIHLHHDSITIATEVKAIWRTGVEMEALTAASAAALTLYDMLKPIDDQMEIASITLLEKKGGKSGSTENGEGLRAAVVVLSDSVSKGEKEDRSGKMLVEKLKVLNIQVSVFKTLPDDQAIIEKELKELSDKEKVDMIITTGGTGISPRDVTPEATESIIGKRLHGVEEMLKKFGQDRMSTAMLSRGVVGLRGTTLIINLPGSVGGVEDGMHALFPAILHTFKMMKGEGH